MSDFSDVDRSASPDRLVRYLDRTDAGLAAMKSYVAAAAARAVPRGGVVVDLGCGVGHDLVRLEAGGLVSIGLDASGVMLGHARRRGVPPRLVAADAAHVPLRTHSIDGCRIERVLQHVVDPAAVVAEIHRVLRPGGFLAALEPDHAGMRIASSDHDAGFLAGSLRARHRRIGADLPALLEAVGFVIDDVVTEASRGYSFDELPVDATTILQRAVVDGRRTGREATAWIAEQRERTAAGTFRSSWVKVLVIGHAA